MPIPPHLAKALSYTSGGIPYQTLLNGYTRQCASDANQIALRVLVGGENLDDFEVDAVGHSSWDGVSSTLNRTLPIQCPLNYSLWCQSTRVVRLGGVNEDGSSYADELYENYPTNIPWFELELTFARPRFYVISDDTLASTCGNKEQFRYVEISRRYVGKEQRQPGHWFEVQQADGEWVTVSVPSFVPTYELEILIRMHEWPAKAFPEAAIADALGTVNYTDFPTGDGFVYGPGKLLFRGPQQPISWFLNAAGDFVVSPTLVFAYRSSGWNKQLLPTRTSDTPPRRQYGAVRLNNTLASPYTSTEFQNIFVPANNPL